MLGAGKRGHPRPGWRPPTTVLETSPLLLIALSSLGSFLLPPTHPPQPHTPLCPATLPWPAPPKAGGTAFLSLFPAYCSFNSNTVMNISPKSSGDRITKDQPGLLYWPLKVSLVCGMGALPHALLYPVPCSLPVANYQVSFSWIC